MRQALDIGLTAKKPAISETGVGLPQENFS
jgi:hypothetical protein